MPTPTPLSLVMSPNFGAVHWDVGAKDFMKNERGGLIIKDPNMAGRVIIFKPTLPGQPPRKMFEIGRHPDCWLKLGWSKDPYSRTRKEVTDDRGYPLMNYFPRIALTFQWMSAADWKWVGESAWFVIPGGVFLNKDGVRERSGANLDIYLNNRRLDSTGNPEPLFPNGNTQVSIAIINRDVHSKFDVPYEGKIIAIDRPLDKHSTGWPAAVWEGPSWPTIAAPKKPEPAVEALEKQADVEEAITDSKFILKNRGPWYAKNADTVWAWYAKKNTLEQMLFLVLACGGAALILWAWSR